MDTTSELRRRRVFAGIALILAPLAAGVAVLVAPMLRAETADRIAEIAAAPGRLETALVIGLFAAALFVFAALGLGHLLREEQPWLGQVGTVLAVVGTVLATAILGGLVAAGEAAQLDTAAATQVWDAATGNAAMVVAIAGVAAAAVGHLLLSAGLIMARTAPLWSAAGLGVGVIVLAIGVFVSSTPWLVAGFAVLFVALAPLGYELIAEPDEAWEHPAHFEGWRPVAGGS